jgi:drug/metabolite transporter (DMT)-like permease
VNNNLKGIIGMVICTLLVAIGQFFLKRGVEIFNLSLISIITNYWLIIGLFMYFIASILLIKALKLGDLSVVFPFVSLSYVWVAIGSMLILSEVMTFINWGGILSILLGVFLLGKGGLNA